MAENAQMVHNVIFSKLVKELVDLSEDVKKTMLDRYWNFGISYGASEKQKV